MMSRKREGCISGVGITKEKRHEGAPMRTRISAQVIPSHIDHIISQKNQILQSNKQTFELH